MKFTPQGTFVDQDGNILNGIVFVAFPGDQLSARAVAIFGSTGRVRGVPLGRPQLAAGLIMRMQSAKGFSLLETVVALGVLATGVLSARRRSLTSGMKQLEQFSRRRGDDAEGGGGDGIGVQRAPVGQAVVDANQERQRRVGLRRRRVSRRPAAAEGAGGRRPGEHRGRRRGGDGAAAGPGSDAQHQRRSGQHAQHVHPRDQDSRRVQRERAAPLDRHHHHVPGTAPACAPTP